MRYFFVYFINRVNLENQNQKQFLAQKSEKFPHYYENATHETK